ncbi:hypothetical protein ACFC51_35275 [Streptomyces sp. NPDC055962]|uniref:hypothetical protein n=1 Tax=Streptomyces sp. NPDC055962 TaxID=3345667 RepID=UPI0035D7D3C9
MFRYRRVRVLTVLLGGWVALTAVERWAEQEPWPGAVLGGLLWACVVAGVWWFAEWTQSPLRTARESRAARAASAQATSARGSGAHASGTAPAPDDDASHDDAPDGQHTDAGAPAPRRPESSTPSRH